MKAVLHTSRFYLREFELTDARTLYLLNSDEEVLRYTGDLPFENEEASRQFILNYDHYERFGFGRWLISDQTNVPYGWCGLKFHPERGFTDIGFRLFSKFWGQGVATETARAVLLHGKNELSLSEIWGRTARENWASRRVLEKIGMTYSHEEACHGIVDAMIYKVRWE